MALPFPIFALVGWDGEAAGVSLSNLVFSINIIFVVIYS
jgi:hypothetical protein